MSGPAAPRSRAAAPRPQPPGALPATVAGLAVALAATSLTGVIAGPRWWAFVVITVMVVVAVGALLRSLGLPAVAIAAGQLAALAGLVTAVFTRSGVLVVLPGPDALRELHQLLGRAGTQVRIGVPPVAESTELLCLVVIALGLVAVVVDVVAVSAAAPAASGLVLLCVLAVPASLSDRLLPWWSFLLGALGYALLLTMDRRRRHLVWSEPAGPGGHFGAAVAMGAGATVLALLAGSAVTVVGTEGRLAGSGAPGGTVTTGIGVNPFTSLRGQLETGEVVELFRVRGLTKRSYLRALTLSRFVERQGWTQGPLDGVIPAGGANGNTLPLPIGADRPVPGPTVQVRIEPIGYVDHWLPSFGYPLALGDVGSDWRYDPNALTVFSPRRLHAGPYTELGVLPQPDPAQLRAAGPAGSPALREIDARYLETRGVSARVAELATDVAAGAPTAYDATVALNAWFTRPSTGFRYDLQTAGASSGDALADFLFTGRTGYCEQFASAMAIMLRTLGIPARVAVGFTPGTVDGDQRVITTADAHAWVEAWFPGSGWLPFDPTPLADGRTVVPGYLTPSTDAPGADPPSPTAAQQPGPTAEPADPVPGAPPDVAVDGGGGSGGGTRIWLGAAGVLVLGVLAGLAPLAVRSAQRRRRLQQVDRGGPPAASAAWEEVLAESADRGVHPALGETVRGTARRLAQAHRLDEPGRRGLGIVVQTVEQSWYGAPGQGATVLLDTGEGAGLADALDAVRTSMARCAPTTPGARLLPRSVLSRFIPARPASRTAADRAAADRPEPDQRS